MDLSSFRKKIWNSYAIVAIVTLGLYLFGSLLFIVGFPKGGLQLAIKLFLLDNLFLYICLFIIGILAFKKENISLFVGIIIGYEQLKNFYQVFFGATLHPVGISAFIIYTTAVLGLVMEIICFLLILMYFKSSLKDKA
jgi:hypothetical protein